MDNEEESPPIKKIERSDGWTMWYMDGGPIARESPTGKQYLRTINRHGTLIWMRLYDEEVRDYV